METHNLYTSYLNLTKFELNSFKTLFFAFSDEQLKEGLLKIGLEKTDLDKIVNLGAGGFIKKSDLADYSKWIERRANELDELLTNETFCYQAFVYELQNHEFSYTHDVTDTLECFGLEYHKLTPVQALALQKAKNYVLANSND